MCAILQPYDGYYFNTITEQAIRDQLGSISATINVDYANYLLTKFPDYFLFANVDAKKEIM